jgi:hypothetical protein
MHRTMLMCAAIAALAVMAACTKKDSNSVTGSTDYTSVALSSNPGSFDLHVRLVPREIDTSTTGTIDTVPAHEVPADSVAFDPIATIMPEDVAIANGTDNMTFTFGNSAASLNESFFVQGDTTGTTTLTVVYTDVNHNFATTTLVLPITVTEVP